MHADLVNIGWTEEQWNRIVTTVTEEAQRARVAAQMLPVSGPEDPSIEAIANYTLSSANNPLPPPPQRLAVNSNPNLFLTTIAVNVSVRTTEAADPELQAALVMFRRAANHIARIEDALVFNGRPGPNLDPPGIKSLPPVFTVHGDGITPGVMNAPGALAVKVAAPTAASGVGQQLFSAVVQAIGELEDNAQLGPFSCVLGKDLFAHSCDPTSSLVLPRDRILPFLQGPLLRSSVLLANQGAVIASGGSPIHVVVARDIDVRFLQTTLEPRLVFRVSERIAVRIHDGRAVAVLS